MSKRTTIVTIFIGDEENPRRRIEYESQLDWTLEDIEQINQMVESHALFVPPKRSRRTRKRDV